ncbi:NAD(P)-binding protein [Paraphaeosphaeria sporulosa]|uniref:NAD(P)-binding protein n=1 Tax=Paraphaeosphaeria sporulosa TaxID=1460663 RepID=A0A177CKZ2_9PLEO|nr:NAD(P)-binding protein [Paraphaeosphaeria sporulosa]OAG07891.1 NAD(P)-binding protein [Paraphaeosphaeria sporulosa]
MTSRINTILIIGGTTGIGEQLVRRFHALDKKVIVTGRNQASLTSLAQALNGLETRQFDITDFSNLQSHVAGILKDFPSLDTVLINAGIQKSFSFFDPSSIAAGEIEREIAANLTAPTLLVQAFAPHLLSLASKGTPATLFVTSSTLGLLPMGLWANYSATKAGVHALALSLRQQIAFASEEAKKNFNVVEIVPPYVDTGLDKEHREATLAAMGERAFPPMPLQEYIDQFFNALDEIELDGSLKKEIGVGTGAMAVQTWRESLGKVYEQFGMAT